MTASQVIEKLKQEQGSRTQRAFAEVLGVSPTYLNLLYSGQRAPGERVLTYMGLEKRVTTTVIYVPR